MQFTIWPITAEGYNRTTNLASFVFLAAVQRPRVGKPAALFLLSKDRPGRRTSP
jgi:hypothetical protein